MTRNEVKKLSKSVIIFDEHFKHLFSVCIVEVGSAELNQLFRHRILDPSLFVAQYIIDAVFEAVDQRLRQLALVVLCLLVLNQSSFDFVLYLFAADFGLQILDHVEATQEILLEVAFNEMGKFCWSALAFIERIFNKPAEPLVEILWLVEAPGPFSLFKTPDLLMHILWLNSRLCFSFLHVLRLKIGMGLLALKLILTVIIIRNLSVPNLIRRVTFICLNCTDVQERVLRRGVFVNVTVRYVFFNMGSRLEW